MKNTILLAESAAITSGNPINEAISDVAFGQIRSLVQKAGSSATSLQQIATALTMMKTPLDELEDTVVPYIQRGLVGVFAAYIPISALKEAMRMNITGKEGELPSLKRMKIIWWMMRLHQGVKMADNAKAPGRTYFDLTPDTPADADRFYEFFDNVNLDFGGANVRANVMVGNKPNFDRIAKMLSRAKNVGTVSTKAEYWVMDDMFGEDEQRAMLAFICDFASKCGKSIKIEVQTEETVMYVRLADLVSDAKKPANLLSLKFIGEPRPPLPGEASEGAIKNKSGFASYSSKKTSQDFEITYI